MQALEPGLSNRCAVAFGDQASGAIGETKAFDVGVVADGAGALGPLARGPGFPQLPQVRAELGSE